jgi:hypothetical protein
MPPHARAAIDAPADQYRSGPAKLGRHGSEPRKTRGYRRSEKREVQTLGRTSTGPSREDTHIQGDSTSSGAHRLHPLRSASLIAALEGAEAKSAAALLESCPSLSLSAGAVHRPANTHEETLLLLEEGFIVVRMDGSGRFPKGISGTPGGRPKGLASATGSGRRSRRKARSGDGWLAGWLLLLPVAQPPAHDD